MVWVVTHQETKISKSDKSDLLSKFSDFLIIITARVAKRVKVMFSQAFVCPSPGGGGGGGQPWTMSQHLPPPPGTRSQHLPPPRDQVTTPPSPRDQVTAPPPPPRDQVTTPPPPPQVLYTGGRYASYWNAFLLCYQRIEIHNLRDYEVPEQIPQILLMADDSPTTSYNQCKEFSSLQK